MSGARAPRPPPPPAAAPLLPAAPAPAPLPGHVSERALRRRQRRIFAGEAHAVLDAVAARSWPATPRLRLQLVAYAGGDGDDASRRGASRSPARWRCAPICIDKGVPSVRMDVRALGNRRRRRRARRTASISSSSIAEARPMTAGSAT